jgi:hypothetical protein
MGSESATLVAPKDALTQDRGGLGEELTAAIGGEACLQHYQISNTSPGVRESCSYGFESMVHLTSRE